MDVFEALADPIRRALLQRLADGSARVVDLAAEHPVTRPAISRHLRLLGEAGLVAAADVGRERHYILTPVALAEVRHFVASLDSPAGEDSPGRRPPVTAQHLDALDTEVRRTRRSRRASVAADLKDSA